MEKKVDLNIQEWCQAFNRGLFDSEEIGVQCDAGWYDWFCTNSLLVKKTKKLGKFLLRIRDSKKINFKHKILFKNNCPYGNDTLYDDIRFVDLETKCIAYVIEFNDKRYEVPVKIVDMRLFNTKLNSNQSQATVFQGTVKEAIKWFNAK